MGQYIEYMGYKIGIDMVEGEIGRWTNFVTFKRDSGLPFIKEQTFPPTAASSQEGRKAAMAKAEALIDHKLASRRS